jgi:hypothetical protein
MSRGIKSAQGIAERDRGRALVAVAPIARGELAAINGGHIVTTAALPSAAPAARPR